MNRHVAFALVLIHGIGAGCVNVRHVAIPKVNDIGPRVVTENKYRLAGYAIGQRNYQFGDIKDFLERSYPNVFADSGIPFTIRETKRANFSTKYGWTFLFPYLLSMGTLPMVMHSEHDTGFTIDLNGAGRAHAEYEVNISMDKSLTCYTPFALLCYNGEPETHGHRGFYRVKAYGGNSNRISVNRSAIGYGAAVKLKELEQAGAIKALADSKPIPASTSSVTNVPPASAVPSVKAPSQTFELNSISL